MARHQRAREGKKPSAGMPWLKGMCMAKGVGSVLSPGPPAQEGMGPPEGLTTGSSRGLLSVPHSACSG